MTYRIKDVIKEAEEEDYYKGCLPNTKTGVQFHFDLHLEAPTVSELLEQAKLYLGDSYTVGMYGSHTNRVDFFRLEDKNGHEFPKSKTEDWKSGKCKVWLVKYTIRIERVEDIDVKECLDKESKNKRLEEKIEELSLAKAIGTVFSDDISNEKWNELVTNPEEPDVSEWPTVWQCFEDHEPSELLELVNQFQEQFRNIVKQVLTLQEEGKI